MSKDLINNIIKESQSDLDVGKVLFGSDRNIASLQNKKPEEDTKIESEYFEYINAYIRDPNGNNHKRDLKKIIPKLQLLKSKFSQVLTPSKSQVYRGTAVKTPTILSLIKKYGYTKSEFNPDWYLLNEEIDYKSSSTITSWSFKFYVAIVFAETNVNHSTFSVIIETITNNSFILNPNFSNIVSTNLQNSREFETISTENNFTNCKVYFPKNVLYELE